MRRSDREITDYNEMLEVIRKCNVCRLVLNDGEYPYVVPLNFGMEIENNKLVFYFHGAREGKKYELMRKNNKASFEMDLSQLCSIIIRRIFCLTGQLYRRQMFLSLQWKP